MIRVLGIDPGSRSTGYGIIDTDGIRSQYVVCGCIRVVNDDWSQRLRTIFDGIRQLIEQYQPQQVAIEKVFMHRNADSALKLGQARGAAICAIATLELPLSEYTPNAVKQSVVGKGHAAKEQVQHMTKVLLQLSQAPQTDATDALAVALCHINTCNTLNNMRGVQGSRRGRYW